MLQKIKVKKSKEKFTRIDFKIDFELFSISFARVCTMKNKERKNRKKQKRKKK